MKQESGPAGAAPHQEPPTPYERGYDAGLAGKPAPPFPTSQASWAQRLYHRGWHDGVEDAHKHPNAREESKPDEQPDANGPSSPPGPEAA